MKARDQHVPIDHLTALALAGRAPADGSADLAEDERVLEHLAVCDDCSAALARLTADADGLRDRAFAEADDVFDTAMLDAQRTRILDRLAHLGQAARVLSFPRRSRDVAMPVAGGSRRWVSVAAAAGLIIGLVAGQLVHLLPSRGNMNVIARDSGVSMQAPDRPAGPMIVPASASVPALSDDDLMEEVEASVQMRRAQSLRALDALTPTAADMLAVR